MTIMMIMMISKIFIRFSFDGSTPNLTHTGQSNYLKNRENSVESFNDDKIDSRSQLIKEQDKDEAHSRQTEKSIK